MWYYKMKRKQRSWIHCMHNILEDRVITMDGEIVCRCGVVIEERSTDNSPVALKNNVSLYHQMENGGDPRDMKVVNKNLYIHSSKVSEFSNICNKLGLPDPIQRRAWKTYDLCRRNTSHTKAKCAIFSIYHACRESSQIVDDIQIQDAVRSVLCVKNASNVLSVISEMHEDVFRLGIDSNKGHSAEYYLNIEIAKKQSLFSDLRDYDRFKIMVMKTVESLTGNNQNKAKRAVTISLNEMGVI